MRRALALMREQAPELEVDGEMNADAALVETIRDRAVPDSRLSGTANLLVMPTLDAANIAFTLLKAAVGRTAGRTDAARACRSRFTYWCRASPRAASSI